MSNLAIRITSIISIIVIILNTVHDTSHLIVVRSTVQRAHCFSPCILLIAVSSAVTRILVSIDKRRQYEYNGRFRAVQLESS